MQREIFLDTETTGLDPEKNRLIEVAAMTFIDRKPEEQMVFHEYCNPQQPIDAEAVKVHGMDAQFLADKPLFADIAGRLQDFLRGGDVFIHNAEFDTGFLDTAFARCNLPPLAEVARSVTCTLKLSRKKNTQFHRHSLDHLCRHYGIDISARGKHNALLDVQLLAKVYYILTREQMAMGMNMEAHHKYQHSGGAPIMVLKATAEERAAHEKYLDAMEQETGVKSVYRGGKPAKNVGKTTTKNPWWEKTMG